ncbi:hypothetical protein [Sideroxydans lithotrophicus]|uniref:Lipoprotein n=1 Tax=Sideroxydans lithotrophicus (strain ES-1) TaxID=580332 RepID=D5CUP7_SIDLE|nr:hypothetical protein [Sideroxydans lithotrophicus]ADE12434.1 hypothetical protein Slit_2206 [Sideroxydans lithotrophicus ES-1]
MKRILPLIVVLLLAACGEDPYRGLYDGIKSNNDAKRTPTERANSPAPSYDEYKKERDSESAK